MADGNGAEALSAIPDALVLVAPGIVGLCAIGLLTRASYVRGRARAVAGAVVAVAWLATTVVPLVALGGAAGPATTVRALALGTSIGLVIGAVALAVLVARSWGRVALTVAGAPASQPDCSAPRQPRSSAGGSAVSGPRTDSSSPPRRASSWRSRPP